MSEDEDFPSEDDQSFTSATSDWHRKNDSGTKQSPLEGTPKADSHSDATEDDTILKEESDERFSPEEEGLLLAESARLKTSANSLFSHGSYGEAIQTYDRALSSCPNYLDYELAILQSNIAACHVKLKDWQAAAISATKSLDSLERIDPRPQLGSAQKDTQTEMAGLADSLDPHPAAVEVDDRTAAAMENALNGGRSTSDIQKIRTKASMRRAKANTELGTTASLQSAEEDLTYLSQEVGLSSLDRITVEKSLKEVKPRLKAAQSKDLEEMMGKLKGLGNSLLKPFGMSTDNFQFVKDEKTGGYSMNFNQGR